MSSSSTSHGYFESVSTQLSLSVGSSFEDVAGNSSANASEGVSAGVSAVDTGMNGKVIEERTINYTSYKDYVRIPFLFQGQYYDEEIKLAYNRFRYYDPELGRYISEDPIGLTGGFALYAYVEDVNGWVDLLGLKPSIIFMDSKGLSLLVKNQQDLSHMTTAQLKYMQKHGVAGTTTGGLKKGREKIILHHQKQNPLGPIIEMPMSKHIQNLGNKNMHPLGN